MDMATIMVNITATLKVMMSNAKWSQADVAPAATALVDADAADSHDPDDCPHININLSVKRHKRSLHQPCSSHDYT